MKAQSTRIRDTIKSELRYLLELREFLDAELFARPVFDLGHATLNERNGRGIFLFGYAISLHGVGIAVSLGFAVGSIAEATR